MNDQPETVQFSFRSVPVPLTFLIFNPKTVVTSNRLLDLVIPPPFQFSAEIVLQQPPFLWLLWNPFSSVIIHCCKHVPHVPTSAAPSSYIRTKEQSIMDQTENHILPSSLKCGPRALLIHRVSWPLGVDSADLSSKTWRAEWSPLHRYAMTNNFKQSRVSPSWRGMRESRVPNIWLSSCSVIMESFSIGSW